MRSMLGLTNTTKRAYSENYANKLVSDKLSKKFFCFIQNKLNSYNMNGGDWKEMFEASQNGDLSLVKYHLKMGVDVNYQHPEILCTALNVSIENGHTDIARYLLEQGADPHIKAIFEGLDAMQTAELYKRKDIIDILKKSGKYL